MLTDWLVGVGTGFSMCFGRRSPGSGMVRWAFSCLLQGQEMVRRKNCREEEIGGVGQEGDEVERKKSKQKVVNRFQASRLAK